MMFDFVYFFIQLRAKEPLIFLIMKKILAKALIGIAAAGVMLFSGIKASAQNVSGNGSAQTNSSGNNGATNAPAGSSQEGWNAGASNRQSSVQSNTNDSNANANSNSNSNSNSNATQSLVNNTNNPAPDALGLFLGGIRPANTPSVQPGQIGTGTNDKSCPQIVYGSNGYNNNYYLASFARTRTTLAPGQDQTVIIHNNCLTLGQIIRLQATPLKTQVAYWNTLSCDESSATIMGELFSRGLQPEYFHMKGLLNRDKTGKLLNDSACVYGISVLFNGRQNVSDSSLGLQLRVRTISQQQLEHRIKFFQIAKKNYLRANNTELANITQVQIDALLLQLEQLK